jgi:hypothetical protein
MNKTDCPACAERYTPQHPHAASPGIQTRQTFLRIVFTEPLERSVDDPEARNCATRVRWSSTIFPESGQTCQ